MVRSTALGRGAALALLLALAAPVPARADATAREVAAGGAGAAAPRASRRPPPPEEEEVRPVFEEHLPAALQRPGPRGLRWWQWLALPVVAVLAVALGALLGLATRRVLAHFASRTRTTWDDELIERIAGPLTALWAIAVATAFDPWLALDGGAALVMHHVLRAATYLVLFWGAFRGIDVMFSAFGAAPWSRENAGVSGLLPLFRKLSKITVLAIGVIAVLNELGFQVASLIAGLGIGGVAVALAAQKTVENLFGSVSIGVDQPFRVGDFVKIEDVSGTVETIGMRSTRIRTLDRTLVTVPNGKLAEMKSETFAARDRIRLYTNLGLARTTTADQLRTILGELEAALRGEAKLWAESLSVRFTEIRDSTLNVEVVAWFRTTDWNEFTALRQDLLLRFLDVVERAGTTLAYPTSTVQVVHADGPERRGGAAPAGRGAGDRHP